MHEHSTLLVRITTSSQRSLLRKNVFNMCSDIIQSPRNFYIHIYSVQKFTKKLNKEDPSFLSILIRG